jgi:hypothetical protein
MLSPLKAPHHEVLDQASVGWPFFSKRRIKLKYRPEEGLQGGRLRS